MDVVIRPVNDRFLQNVLFPVFEQGVVDAVPALERLLELIDDDRTNLLIETLLTKGVEGSFFTMDAATWLEAVHRLLFCEWIPSRKAWSLGEEYQGFAAPIGETLHLSLMLEDPDYRYWNPVAARTVRELFFDEPTLDREVSAFISGRWDRFPDFPPDQTLSTNGRTARYDPREKFAVCDWTWRSSAAVAQMTARLPQKLASLLKREADRLRPVEIPEQQEIYDYWVGRAEKPPMLTVAYSGLGTSATSWVRDLGLISRVFRSAAELEQGLTAILAPPGKQQAYGDY